MTAMWAASPSELLYKAASKAAGRRRSVALRRLPLIIGLVLLAIAILAVTFAPLLTSAPPNQIDVLNPLAPPLTPGHLLGTDQFGRDVLSRILYGGRIDLAIAFGATSVTLVGGTIIGLVAGYFGGKIDNVLMRIVDLFFAFPFLVLIIAIIAMLGPSLFNIFLAIWITSWVAYARIMRAQVIVAKKQQYVLAARALGYSRHPGHAPAHPAQHRLRRDHLLDGRRDREHHPGRLAGLPRPRRAAAHPGMGHDDLGRTELHNHRLVADHAARPGRGLRRGGVQPDRRRPRRRAPAG